MVAPTKRLTDKCPRCASADSYDWIPSSDLKLRIVRLFTPFDRVRCHYCGSEAWVWRNSWSSRQSGEIPPGLFLVLGLFALLLALYLVR